MLLCYNNHIGNCAKKYVDAIEQNALSRTSKRRRWHGAQSTAGRWFIDLTSTWGFIDWQRWRRFRGLLGGKVGSACEEGLLGGKVGSACEEGLLGGKVGSACEEFEDTEGGIYTGSSGFFLPLKQQLLLLLYSVNYCVVVKSVFWKRAVTMSCRMNLQSGNLYTTLQKY